MDVKPISGDEFDRRFDDGEDMADFIDWTGERHADKVESVAIDLPSTVVVELDSRAERAGLTRQAFLQQWITTHLRDVA